VVPDWPRAVDDTTSAPSVSAISFQGFEFQEPAFLHAGPALFRIDGEPVRGREYVVEAVVYNDEAIATARFVAVDQNGALLEPLAIARKPGPLGSWRFVGSMTVPTHPFRIVLEGEGIDGSPFTRAHKRLFRPADSETSRTGPAAGLSESDAALLRQMVDEAGPRLIAEVQADLVRTPSGMIVMPRMQVSNVRYTPLRSPDGRPVGVRLEYDVRFSERGQYNPDVRVDPRYPPREWQGLSRLQVLRGEITPRPREAHPPYDPILLGELRSTPLEAGAHYTYEAGVVYHFTADMVPDYAVHNLQQTRACIHYQKFRHAPGRQQAFSALLASDAPAEYRVSIGRTAFTGVIRSFYGDGTFHRSFVDEGAQDCGAQPTRRF
jgi:hypothetical protein